MAHLGDGHGLIKPRRGGVQQLPQLEVGQLVCDHAQPHVAHEVLGLQVQRQYECGSTGVGYT